MTRWAVAEKSDRKQVVVLIDEYDEPVAAFLDDLPTLRKVREDLHEFYEKLKINAGFIRFLMMTGVTKFTKLSIFSGVNHLKDRSGVYVGKSAKEAVEQARTKDYAGPWLDGNPSVFYVGVNYDPDKRGVGDPLVEPA